MMAGPDGFIRQLYVHVPFQWTMMMHMVYRQKADKMVLAITNSCVEDSVMPDTTWKDDALHSTVNGRDAYRTSIVIVAVLGGKQFSCAVEVHPVVIDHKVVLLLIRSVTH